MTTKQILTLETLAQRFPTAFQNLLQNSINWGMVHGFTPLEEVGEKNVFYTVSGCLYWDVKGINPNYPQLCETYKYRDDAEARLQSLSTYGIFEYAQ